MIRRGTANNMPIENIIYLTRALLRLYRRVRRAQIRTGAHAWTWTQGRVENAFVRPEDDGLVAEVLYSYQVEGEYYSGSYVERVRNESSGERVVQQYPTGTQISLRYNPARPQQSLMETPSLTASS